MGLTLSKARQSGRLAEFIEQEERRGLSEERRKQAGEMARMLFDVKPPTRVIDRKARLSWRYQPGEFVPYNPSQELA